MFKKIFSMFLSGMLLFSTMGTIASAAVPNTAEDKLAAIEVTLYGSPQTGSLVERITKLEKDYEGEAVAGGMMDRINALYDATYDNSREPSLITQMNALEWAISHNVSMDSMQNRVIAMESYVNGHTSDGTFRSRIEDLSAFAFGSREIPLVQTTVPANTLARIELVTPVNAKKLKEGDIIKFKASEDVIEDSMLIFTAGAMGEGVITKVSQAKNFGRDAEVQIDFRNLSAVDGTQVEMLLGEEAQENMEQMGLAAGASIAGMAILGPVGIITGVFVQGKNVDLPEGTELYIQTAQDTVVYAIPTTE